MHGFVLGFLGLVVAADPIEMPKDVHEIQTRQFVMPVRMGSNYREKVTKIRLFVSEDQGETWKHKRDYNPSEKKLIFTARHDGLYWFALQAVLNDGSSEPAEVDDLLPVMKVYVNSERKPFQAKKSYEELQREVDQLRRTIEQLQQRIKQLESERKTK